MIQLNSQQLAHIMIEKEIFQKIEHLTSVPWQAIAAVWYRESFSIAPPHTPGGPFQFDPIPDELLMGGLANKLSTITPEGFAAYWKAGFNNFEAAAFFCALWLRHKSKYPVTVDANDVVVKDMFWGYNGRAFHSADNSNYVMNGADDAHMNMVISGSIPDAHSPNGRKYIHTVDHRPGAFTVYRQLKALA